MSDVVIRVEGLGKKFKIGTSQPHHRLSEALVGLARSAARLPMKVIPRSNATTVSPSPDFPEEGEFWALKDINFEIKQGDVVGIIGRNGAGKSTLLKILSRITEPTEGRFGIKGRVASLLEVGTGFHPELTGRENIFLSGSVLGMSKAEIRRKFDEIVAFAGTEKFLDTPVKRYSSGMQVRLGFAIAAHLEPEVLIVDEVLAVGDAEFQKKCLGKMSEVSHSGRTILFVSHSMVAVRSLCKSAIVLDHGRLSNFLSIDDSINAYTRQQDVKILHRSWDPENAPGCDDVKLLSAGIEWDQTLTDELNVQTPFSLTFRFDVRTSGKVYNPSVVLWRSDGTAVLNTFTGEGPWSTNGVEKGQWTTRVHIPGNLLNNGFHRVDLLLVRDRGQVVYRDDTLLSFDLEDTLSGRDGWYGTWIGAVRPSLLWENETN